MMKKYKVTFEWRIQDKKEIGGFRVGTSRLWMQAKNIEDAINEVLFFAENVPDYEISNNGINTDDYKDGNSCVVNYRTTLNKIIKIERVKEF